MQTYTQKKLGLICFVMFHFCTALPQYEIQSVKKDILYQISSFIKAAQPAIVVVAKGAADAQLCWE